MLYLYYMYVLSTRTIEGLIRDCDSIEAPSHFFLCYGAHEKSTVTLGVLKEPICAQVSKMNRGV